MRVHDGDRRRQQLRRLVVIRDHDVDPERSRPRHRLQRRDAAVHGDDQRAASAPRVLDRIRRQTVAVARAVWDPELDPRSEVAQHGVEQVGRGDAVHIVIPVDQDALAVLDRGPDAVHGTVHVQQRRGIVQVVQRRLQEPPRRFHRLDSAIHQRVRRGPRRAQIASQRSRPLRIMARMQHPLQQHGRCDHVDLSNDVPGRWRGGVMAGGAGDEATLILVHAISRETRRQPLRRARAGSSRARELARATPFHRGRFTDRRAISTAHRRGRRALPAARAPGPARGRAPERPRRAPRPWRA